MSAEVREKDGLSIEEGMRIAVGTPGYSAPEQFSGLAAGKAADVHAIGAMIYACYQGEMPGCWRRIYLAATASNPKSRYQTVQELRRAVRTRHLRKTALWALVAVLFGVVVFMIVSSAQKHAVVERMPHKFHVKGR
jgi:serine/threonine protein kinase